ncbi:hypothetical protein ABZ413_06165 [Nocardia rhamnosiphila]|uniref:hypothetical protein n=1 Tax=Nocardia rhamnosiphila TaxID=426716 RepID=UPI0033ECBD1C
MGTPWRAAPRAGATPAAGSTDWPHGEGFADPTTFTADIPQFPEFSYEGTRHSARPQSHRFHPAPRFRRPDHSPTFP